MDGRSYGGLRRFAGRGFRLGGGRSRREFLSRWGGVGSVVVGWRGWMVVAGGGRWLLWLVGGRLAGGEELGMWW